MAICFLGHYKCDKCQTLDDGTTHWALSIYTISSGLESQQCQTVLTKNVVLIRLSWNFVVLLSVHVDHEYTTIFDFCTYSREINGVFPDFTHTHTRTKLYHWLFHGHCPSEVFQTLQGYNLAWGLEVWWLWPCFKVTAVSESPTANCCLDSCPL